MKLIVTNFWQSDKLAHHTNKDGILRALAHLRDDYGWETKFIKKGEPGVLVHPYIRFEYAEDVVDAVLAEEPDVILLFCDLSFPEIGKLGESGIPIAMCFTGGMFDQYEDIPDIIFVESQVYYDRFKSHGRNVRRAFGTNQDIFHPVKGQPKIFDACYPATMARWKRTELFAEAMGSRGIGCGYFQTGEEDVWQNYLKFGTALLHHQNAESINLIYNMSKTCVVAAASDGGCQRTVLESMACGVPVIAMSDSDKTTEYVLESGFGKIVAPNASSIRAAVQELIVEAPNPQIGIDYITENYSSKKYAKELYDGILEICR
jgi:glycosyltransferase involved in cell wall biosynthesis